MNTVFLDLYAYWSTHLWSNCPNWVEDSKNLYSMVSWCTACNFHPSFLWSHGSIIVKRLLKASYMWYLWSNMAASLQNNYCLHYTRGQPMKVVFRNSLRWVSKTKWAASKRLTAEKVRVGAASKRLTVENVQVWAANERPTAEKVKVWAATERLTVEYVKNELPTSS